MKTIKYIAFLVVMNFLLTGCKKDEKALEPTELTIQYQLPQGNHDYDPLLVDFNKRFGSFFLYKFSDVDFSYNPVFTNVSSNFGSNYTVDQPDEAYVGKVLAFVQKNWLNYYPDEFLKANLPFKVLLGQNLRSKAVGNLPYNVLSNYNQMTLSNFSAAFDSMTDAQKKAYVNSLQTEFFNYIFNRGKLDIPVDFTALSNYTVTVSAANMYSFGFLLSTISYLDNKPSRDFLSYTTAITTKTKAELDATIMSPANDVNGLVKRKYNIIINYYKTKYNLDLQAIGNGGVIN